MVDTPGMTAGWLVCVAPAEVVVVVVFSMARSAIGFASAFAIAVAAWQARINGMVMSHVKTRGGETCLLAADLEVGERLGADANVEVVPAEVRVLIFVVGLAVTRDTMMVSVDVPGALSASELESIVVERMVEVFQVGQEVVARGSVYELVDLFRAVAEALEVVSLVSAAA